MIKKKLLFFVLVVLIPVFFQSCGSPQTLPHIILIVTDALRAKQLPCYGFEGINTPHIDQFARQSVVFNRALVRLAVTQPSFSSLFSGEMLPKNLPGLGHIAYDSIVRRPYWGLSGRDPYYPVKCLTLDGKRHIILACDQRKLCGTAYPIG